MESADAIDDSDDEVDYTKMDQGNKKGPIGRWDFDTQEEYSDYMANKEALPKWVLPANNGTKSCIVVKILVKFSSQCNVKHLILYKRLGMSLSVDCFLSNLVGEGVCD